MLAIAEEILGLYERPRTTWLPSLRPGAKPGEDDDEGEQADAPVGAEAPHAAGLRRSLEAAPQAPPVTPAAFEDVPM